MRATDDALDRLDRVESHLAIQQLPIRYALAVDGRDIDGYVSLFEPDVNMGRAGRGRDLLRAYIEPLIRGFYRSVHLIGGHRVEFVDRDRATGQVYCRAEHEDGEQWVVMAICYFDEYVRVDGEWFFARRKERHWFAADITDRPQAVGFNGWADKSPTPELPHAFPTWTAFWAGDPSVGTLTAGP